MSSSAVPANVATPPKQFLARCAEELDPKLRISFERQSRLWQVLAVATLVAYTALAVSIFIAVGVYAPVYLPIAGICSLLVADQVPLPIFRRFDQNSENAKKRAVQLKEIHSKYQELIQMSPEQRQSQLNQIGIISTAPSSLEPLVARYKYWESSVQKATQEMQKHLQKANELATKDYVANRKPIYELRIKALEAESDALEAKIKQAYVYAVLQRPTIIGNLDTVGDFSPISQSERTIGVAVGHIALNNFFSFKDTAHTPLTAHDVKTMSTAQLSQRLLAAAPVA